MRSFILSTIYFLPLIILMSIISGCDVHQFPDPKDEPTPNPPTPPDQPVKTVMVPLDLTYQTDFYIWHHDYDPKLGLIEEKYPDADIYPGYPGTTEKYSNIAPDGVMDVHVKVYKSAGTNRLISEQIYTQSLKGDAYDHDLELALDANSTYTVALWSHLREHSEADAFYNATDFNRVGLIPENYAGNTDYRDGFSATATIVTGDEDAKQPYSILMTRPMGKFELVTIDLSEFLDRETKRRGLATRANPSDYHVQVNFPMYYPSSYSVFDDRLENASTGVNFWTFMTVNGETEASLGFEYVLLNDILDGAVQMQVEIYDPSYQHVAGSMMLTVPMRRDTHTKLRGTFLTIDSEGSGGVGIDPGFNGDHNIIQ